MRAASLGDVIRNFNNQEPLTPARREEWENFYIDTLRLDISLIKNEFLRATTGHKVLFGGHMGNGKSTELNKLVYDPQIQERFTLIKFDVREILNLHDIEIVELLLTICFQILTFAGERNIPMTPYIKEKFLELERFFHDRLKIESSRVTSSGKDIGVESEASGGFKIPFLKLKAGFYAKMRGQLESRRMVREEYRPRLNELIDLVGRAALESDTIGGTTIGENDMKKAVIAEKIEKTRTLNRSHWDTLMEIHQHKNFLSEMDENKLELLLSLTVLEYINDDEWYAVSPLLQERLEEYKKFRGREKKENAGKKG
jgi:hypothetical protein